MNSIASIQLQDTPARAVLSAVCAAGVCVYFYGYWFSYGLA